jgi:hypothetical protein
MNQSYNMHTIFHLAVHLLRTYSKELIGLVCKDAHSVMYSAALFIILEIS